MEVLYLVHYGEIALKGKNRPDFERKLAENIEHQHPGARVQRLRGRMLVRSAEPLDLSTVFGVAWWTRAVEVSPSVQELRRQALELTETEAEDAKTFAVRVRRADKSFSMKSQELERLVGGDLDEAFRMDVNLGDPDFTLGIEIVKGRGLVFGRRREGLRGLPAGISGSLLGLYSAGIDSAVAAYMMGKRGVKVELVHFHALADAEAAHQSKAGRLAQRIADFFPSLAVHYVPYHHFQIATMGLDRHQRQELVVFRRFMARAAWRLAREQGALGIFSGDNLGQVASQTLENLAAVDIIDSGLLLRPLVAYDKQEIIDIGIQLGFDPLANEAYKDCCSIIARHPATRANLDVIEQIEASIGIEDVVDRSLNEAEIRHYSPRSALQKGLAAGASG